MSLVAPAVGSAGRRRKRREGAGAPAQVRAQGPRAGHHGGLPDRKGKVELPLPACLQPCIFFWLTRAMVYFVVFRSYMREPWFLGRVPVDLLMGQ